MLTAGSSRENIRVYTRVHMLCKSAPFFLRGYMFNQPKLAVWGGLLDAMHSCFRISEIDLSMGLFSNICVLLETKRRHAEPQKINNLTWYTHWMA